MRWLRSRDRAFERFREAMVGLSESDFVESRYRPEMWRPLWRWMQALAKNGPDSMGWHSGR
jgi:hypothetical protein